MNPSPDIIESIKTPARAEHARFIIFRWLLVGIAVLLLGRSFYLQIVKGSDFRQQAEHNRVDIALIPAPRGIIRDQAEVPLVENISSTDLVFDPVLLPPPEDEAYLLENIPRLVPDITAPQVRAALTKARATQQPVLLAKALDHDVVLSLQEAGDTITGAKLVSSLVRHYLVSQPTAHIVGYTNAVTSEELAADTALYPTDTTGKTGIEKIRDKELRGTHGAVYTEVNATGRPQTALGQTEAVAGSDLQLTIDIGLQEFIHRLFVERDEQRQEAHEDSLAGAVVVLDSQMGEVHALVSYPSFDPNTFSQPALSRQNKAYFEDAAQPLFNRAVDGTYASGSIIKPFLAAAALQEGIITANTTVLSTGGLSVGPWHFPDWKAGGHGITDVQKAIAESVNTFFYSITGGYESQPGLGIERSKKYMEMFGWAKPTGIDLPSENTGFLPSPQWKKDVKKESWYIGDTYHLAIGQGDVLVTPLQVAVGTAALATGYVHQPHLVSDNSAKTRLPISPGHLATVREGMRQAVTEGSARTLFDLPIPLAGKTGTAQIGGTDKTHAWFTSFGPYDHPEFVVTVLLERGGEGDKDAVPFAKGIWQYLVDHQTESPD